MLPQHEQEMSWILLPFLLVILIIFFIGLTEYRDLQRLRLYKENEGKRKSPIRVVPEQEERSGLSFKITLAFQQELDGNRAPFENEEESVKRVLNVECEPHAQLQNEEDSEMRMLNMELERLAQFVEDTESDEKIVEAVDKLISEVQEAVNAM
jgi:hypothetical protein